MTSKARIALAAAQLAGFAVLGACNARHEPVPELDLSAALPPVAAGYTTSVVHGGERDVTQWRFFREGERLFVDNLDDRTGERWQRDGRTLFHQKVFHDDARAIGYQAADLRMLGLLPMWTRQALLVDPALLDTLAEIEAGWRGGYPFRRYAGEVDGVRWDITLRLDLMLPVEIGRAERGARQRTRLEEAFRPQDAPWQPIPTAAYRLLDYADLGDHERDPFVAGLHRRLAPSHAH